MIWDTGNLPEDDGYLATLANSVHSRGHWPSVYLDLYTLLYKSQIHIGFKTRQNNKTAYELCVCVSQRITSGVVPWAPPTLIFKTGLLLVSILYIRQA